MSETKMADTFNCAFVETIFFGKYNGFAYVIVHSFQVTIAAKFIRITTNKTKTIFVSAFDDDYVASM